MNTTLDTAAIRELLAADLAARTEWDQSPELRLLLTNNDGTPWIGDRNLIPGHIWQRWPVPDVLRRTVAIFANHPAAQAARVFIGAGTEYGMQGITLYAETWTVKQTDTNQADLEKLTSKRRLYTHPDRIEARVIYAALIDGTGIAVMQFRGNEPGVVDHAEGDIPDALREICDFFQGP